ncbi:hypothetical protein IV102_10840 [bacterium]|nr:hypothetical protein [bacterium]
MLETGCELLLGYSFGAMTGHATRLAWRLVGLKERVTLLLLLALCLGLLFDPMWRVYLSALLIGTGLGLVRATMGSVAATCLISLLATMILGILLPWVPDPHWGNLVTTALLGMIFAILTKRRGRSALAAALPLVLAPFLGELVWSVGDRIDSDTIFMMVGMLVGALLGCLDWLRLGRILRASGPLGHDLE